MESKLQQSLNIITDAQAELNARVKGVWEAYICYNLPNLEFPHSPHPLKEYVQLAKKSLTFYTDKELSPMVVPTDEKTTQSSSENKNASPSSSPSSSSNLNATTAPITKEAVSTETDNSLYLGLAFGAVLLGGGFYFFMKKKEA